MDFTLTEYRKFPAQSLSTAGRCTIAPDLKNQRTMRRSFVAFFAGLVLLLATLAPGASAYNDTTSLQSSPDFLARDDPGTIAALKSHAAYVGASQLARMDGIIRYVDRLSAGTKVSELQWIRDDYLATLSSIPLMYHTDEINDARQKVQDLSAYFAFETGLRVAELNGSEDSLRAYIDSSMAALELSEEGRISKRWIATGRARQKLFDNSSEQRNATLTGLGAQGLDIADAQKISDRIDAERSTLMEVLAHRSTTTIQAVNGRIKILNQDYRSLIRQYRSELEIRTRTAAILAMKE